MAREATRQEESVFAMSSRSDEPQEIKEDTRLGDLTSRRDAELSLTPELCFFFDREFPQLFLHR